MAPARLLAEVLGGSQGDYLAAVLERRSLDARHKGAIRFLLTLTTETALDLTNWTLPAGVKVEPASAPLSWSVPALLERPRVVVVGTGPAGTFCALRLLDYGHRARGPGAGSRHGGAGPAGEPALERGRARSDRQRPVRGRGSGNLQRWQAHHPHRPRGHPLRPGDLRALRGRPPCALPGQAPRGHGCDPPLCRAHAQLGGGQGGASTASGHGWPICVWRRAGSVRRSWIPGRNCPAKPWCSPRDTPPGTRWRCCTGTGSPCARRPSPWGCASSIPRTSSTGRSTVHKPDIPACPRPTTSWCATWAPSGPPTASACAPAARSSSAPPRKAASWSTA